MKILFYNWDKIDGHVGGGVTVYQRNLVKYLLREDKDNIYVLNSGYSYSVGGKLTIKQISNEISDKVKTFEIFNSPVLAPVQQSILNVRYYLEDTTLYYLMKQFIKSVGGFDVVHFNNIEGLSLSVLKLKEDFPNTKFIYSLHNYFPICTMVSLWNIQKNCNCRADNYNDCAECHKYMSYHAVSCMRKFFGYFRGAGRIGSYLVEFFLNMTILIYINVLRRRTSNTSTNTLMQPSRSHKGSKIFLLQKVLTKRKCTFHILARPSQRINVTKAAQI